MSGDQHDSDCAANGRPAAATRLQAIEGRRRKALLIQTRRPPERRGTESGQIGKSVVDFISSMESRPVTLYISTSEISAW